MNASAKAHLAKAKEYIGRGEQFYRMAAEQILAAKAVEPLTWDQVGVEVGMSGDWCREVVRWHEETEDSGNSGEPAPLPFARKENDHRDRSAARKVLREAPAEQIAEMLAEPEIRQKVHEAQDIAHRETITRSREAERQAIGESNADALEGQQTLRDAEAELFKTRRGLIETLRLLNNADADAIPDSWREEFLRTLDDVVAKAELVRELLAGTLDEELDKILAGEA